MREKPIEISQGSLGSLRVALPPPRQGIFGVRRDHARGPRESSS